MNARDDARQSTVALRPGHQRDLIRDEIRAQAQHIGVVDPAHS